MKWFNRFMNQYGPMYFHNYPTKSNIITPQAIPNETLISKPSEMFPENKRYRLDNDLKYYTGIYLDKTKKINEEFTIVNEGLYNWFEKYWYCNTPIIR